MEGFSGLFLKLMFFAGAGPFPLWVEGVGEEVVGVEVREEEEESSWGGQ